MSKENKELRQAFMKKRQELELQILKLITDFENEYGGRDNCIMNFHIPAISEKAKLEGKKYETTVIIDGKNFLSAPL